MIRVFIFGILMIVLMNCHDRPNESHVNKESAVPTIDTVIASKIITNEIPGGSYRKRAKGYFLVVHKDTSSFTCIFSELKAGGVVTIDLNIPYLKRSMTYEQRMKELKYILSVAEGDFNFDSLKSISFGRLILSGDLAIDITKQYQKKFGTRDNIVDHKTVSLFLKESKLATDLNDILRPYSIKVNHVSPEKLFFTSKEDLFWASRIKTDTTTVPDKILDCLTWVSLINE
jgi:hypothetical protein